MLREKVVSETISKLKIINTMKTVDEIKAAIASKNAEIETLNIALRTATRTPKDHGAIEAARKLEKTEKYKTRNGLTIYGLRKAGNDVKVTHVRYATMKDVAVPVPVPSYLRKFVDFTARGGATHIVITTATGETVAVSSVCHEDDSFDYKLGVKIALDQISDEEADYLLNPAEAEVEA